MKMWAVLAFLALAPTPLCAQGAVMEDWSELATQPPPAFRGTTLPPRVDLSGKIPRPRSQADTSTCVSWAITYAAASLALRAQNANLTLSPAFTYNRVSGDSSCQSSTSASKTLDYLKNVGALPIEEYAFDAGYCGRIATPAELQRAGQFRIKGWSAFNAANVERVKQQLASGSAVIFNMYVGPRFRSLRGDAPIVGIDTIGDGHAMAAVGYDDSKNAVMIQNSWGTNWGSGGYGWMSWDFWRAHARTAYVIVQ